MTVTDYSNAEENNLRWLDFGFRDGDIVVSTRSKHGTTWVQMICALLVHGTPDLPAPLGELSPWIDRRTETRAQVFGRLERQTHRRVIKTHTPLDGVVIDPRATYVVVARHPLDAAVSLWHQMGNLDHRRIDELTGQEHRPRHRPDLNVWLRSWIDNDVAPKKSLESVNGVLWHLGDAWARRHAPNLVLVHFDDLIADLSGEMDRLARRLGTPDRTDRWDTLVEAARFASMRARAGALAPDASGVLIDPTSFFRRGGAGEAAAVLHRADLERYQRRVESLATGDLVAWLHRGR